MCDRITLNVGIIAGIMAATIYSQARAQEMPLSSTPSAYNWTGFYLGGSGGWAWADIEASELSSTDFGFYFLPGDSYGLNSDGFMIGGQVGYDWQWNQFVLGVAAQVGDLDLNSSVADPNSFVTGAPVTSFTSGPYGALTGRVGIAWNRVLAYAKGGVAVLDASGRTLDECGRSFCGQTRIDARGDDLLLGWTIGAGLELAMTNHLSVGAEYGYFSFEDLQVSGESIPPGFYSQDIQVNFQSVRGFVNFRW